MSKFDAKTVTAWVKNRWSLVAFVVVAVLIVPAMVYFAMGMISAKQKKFQDQVNEDAKDFTAPVINYKAAGLLPGEPSIDWTGPPNQVAIDQFNAVLKRQQDAAGALVNEAIAFNRGSRKVLLDNVFPSPPPNDLTLAKQFRRVFVGEAINGLLSILRAGEPMPPAQLAQILQDYENNFLQRQLGTDSKDGRARLSQEKVQELDKEMVDLRIRQYTLWAQKLSVYAGRNAFTLPVVDEAKTPTMTELWDWQVELWTMQDILQSVAAANEPARDRGVTASVVKRIMRLSIDGGTVAMQTGGTVDPAAAVPVLDGGAADYSRSITGRATNPLYDVRKATLECVVATSELPRLFDAIARTNLMTVTGVSLSKVDVPADLREGFYYGDEHVSRAVISIESVWLREWTKDLMPTEVKVALGMEAGDPGAVPPDGSSPAPAPQGPAPSGRRAGSAGG